MSNVSVGKDVVFHVILIYISLNYKLEQDLKTDSISYQILLSSVLFHIILEIFKYIQHVNCVISLQLSLNIPFVFLPLSDCTFICN